ncbi:unnamed protein product, partial [Mesorhabditis belari]|uniref:G protein-coupled receptor n=1 Tax=Mesorhabditis belari TaxID=2138241 RepID=A0AAF3J4H5_9BILA
MAEELDVHSGDTWFATVRIISVLGSAINLLGLYILLRYSPKEMREYSLVLINLQVIAILGDHIAADAATAFMLLPATAGISLGWLSLIGVRSEVQGVYVGGLMGQIQGATVCLFLARFQFILPQGHYFKLTTRARYASYVALNVFPYLHMNLMFLFGRDQNVAGTKAYYLRLYPEFRQFIELDIFYGVPEGRVFLLMANLSAFVVSMFALGSALSFGCISSLRQQEKVLETRLVNSQRRLVKALMIQVAIPAITLALPTLFGVLSVFSGTTAYSRYNPILLLFYSQHGFANTIAVLTLYKPYREGLKSTLQDAAQRKTHNAVIKPPHFYRRFHDSSVIFPLASAILYSLLLNCTLVSLANESKVELKLGFDKTFDKGSLAQRQQMMIS